MNLKIRWILFCGFSVVEALHIRPWYPRSADKSKSNRSLKSSNKLDPRSASKRSERSRSGSASPSRSGSHSSTTSSPSLSSKSRRQRLHINRRHTRRRHGTSGGDRNEDSLSLLDDWKRDEKVLMVERKRSGELESNELLYSTPLHWFNEAQTRYIMVSVDGEQWSSPFAIHEITQYVVLRERKCVRWRVHKDGEHDRDALVSK